MERKANNETQKSLSKVVINCEEWANAKLH